MRIRQRVAALIDPNPRPALVDFHVGVAAKAARNLAISEAANAILAARAEQADRLVIALRAELDQTEAHNAYLTAAHGRCLHPSNGEDHR